MPICAICPPIGSSCIHGQLMLHNDKMDSSLLGSSMGELLLVFGAVFITTYLFYRRYKVGDRSHNLPPTLPSLPVVGSLPFLPTKMADMAKFGISERNKLGKVFLFHAGSKYDMMFSLFVTNGHRYHSAAATAQPVIDNFIL